MTAIDLNFEKYDMEYLVTQYEYMDNLYNHPESFGDERKEKLRIAFDSFDKDGSGYLDKHEVMDLLRMNVKESGIHKQPTEADVDTFFKSIDESGDQSIDFEEFRDFMLRNMAERLIVPLRDYLTAEGFNLPKYKFDFVETKPS